jgi:hypothetical protein
MSKNALEVLATKPSRTLNVFEIPADVAQGEMPIQSIGLHELTADEEIQAAQRSRGDSFQLAAELTKQALVEVNGKPVSLGDGSVDSAFNRMGSQIRNLVMEAYSNIHSPPQGAAKSFLRTRKVIVR